jgi:hypothetical protein
VYQCIFIPYRLAFAVAIVDTWEVVIDYIVTAMFMLDIVLNFNTGFYSKGMLIVSRKQIALNYIKFWFWLDLLASFPYDVIVESFIGKEDEDNAGSNSMYKAPRLLRLIKIFRFLRILKLIRIAKLKQIIIKLEDFFTSLTFSTLFVIFKLLAVIGFIAHWTACWFYFVSFEDSFFFQDVWIRHSKTIDMSVRERYVTSLYWALTTMTTVGYGDVIPRSANEKVYAMAAMIIACGTFAYTVGSVGGIISKQSADETLYRERAIAVNLYMKKNELPYDL